MQSPVLLQSLAQKVIWGTFIANKKLSIAMPHYDLWHGMALVGGLFSHSQLLVKHECFSLFEAIKKSIDNHISIHMKNTLQAAS